MLLELAMLMLYNILLNLVSERKYHTIAQATCIEPILIILASNRHGLGRLGLTPFPGLSERRHFQDIFFRDRKHRPLGPPLTGSAARGSALCGHSTDRY